MARYYADTETNGFLAEATLCHSLVLKNLDCNEIISCSDHSRAKLRGYFPIACGLDAMANADLVVGHNWVKFDAAILKKLYGWDMDEDKVEDTLILSRMFFPEVGFEIDTKLKNEGKLPGNMWGRHSLEAWGYRLGNYKGDYAAEMKAKGLDPWAEWNPEMQAYCEQDCDTGASLHNRVAAIRLAHGPEAVDRAIELEHQIAWCMAQQERNGFPFDVKKAGALYAKLVGKRTALETELETLFEPWWVPSETKTVSKTRKVKHDDSFGTITVPRVGKNGKALKPYVGPPLCEYEEGAIYSPIKRVTFNPGSRAHIADRFTKLHGWVPKAHTKTGLPEVNDSILIAMPYPEAKPLANLFMLQKRVAMIAEGPQAWLKMETAGKIHGSVNTNACVTARASHSHPNIGQVPSPRVPYGTECRECFYVDPKWGVLVGSDQDALELRCLAGYMALWDNGAYIDTVLRGDKDKGTDLHSVNSRALGLDPLRTYPVNGKQQTGRDLAKTWFYAFVYGAGNVKLGEILGEKVKGKAAMRGKASRASFLRKLPALGKLIEAVKETLKTRGYLIALDGRRLPCRSEHSALNTLLQCAGALICKKWVVLIEERLRASGLTPGWDGDYAMLAWVHDEVQCAVKPEHVELFKTICEETAVEAGEFYKFACPTAANCATGQTWADTH